MPETLEEKRARLAKHAAEQAQLAEEIRLAEEAAKREAEAAEARRKAAEEAERRKAAEGQQSGGPQKRAIELSSDEEEEETPRKKHARKRQETAKGKGKATDDGPPVESRVPCDSCRAAGRACTFRSGGKARSCLPCHRAHTGCTFGGKPSMGPVSEVRAGPVAGPSAPALQEAVWSADPAPAHLLTGEELLRTLLVEVQGLHVQLRDDLGAARTEIRRSQAFAGVRDRSQLFAVSSKVGAGAEGLESSSQLRSIQQQLGINAGGEEEGAVLNRKLDAANAEGFFRAGKPEGASLRGCRVERKTAASDCSSVRLRDCCPLVGAAKVRRFAKLRERLRSCAKICEAQRRKQSVLRGLMTGGPAEFEPFRERIETVLQTRANQLLLLARFRLAYAQGLRQASEVSLRLDGFRLEALRERADTAVHVLRFAGSGGGAALQAAWQLRREVDCLQRAHRAATAELDRLEEQGVSAVVKTARRGRLRFPQSPFPPRTCRPPSPKSQILRESSRTLAKSFAGVCTHDLTPAKPRYSGDAWTIPGASLCARLDVLLSVAGRPSGTLIRFRMAYALAAQQAATRAAHVLRLRLSLLEGQLGATVRSLYLAGDEGATSLSAALDLLAAVCPLREMADATALRLDRLEEQLERVRRSFAAMSDPMSALE
ncbi:hypothetical protein OH77DRAFT_1440491 [Trametes cingulata]|nr:hypothetical protein OH77DRAFT_1440491 [Trametes cingulata]